MAFLWFTVSGGGVQDSKRSFNRAVRDRVREGWNKIICFQTDLGTPMQINNNYTQALKNEVGLVIIWCGRENTRMEFTGAS